MARLIGCIAFGVPTGVVLCLGISYVVVMYFGHPTLIEGF